jgi:hypothetical protein
MREGMTEHMGVEVLNPRLPGTSPEHLADAAVGHSTSTTDPQLCIASDLVLAALSQVPLDRLACLVSERTSSRPPTFTKDQGNVRVKIDISNGESGHL